MNFRPLCLTLLLALAAFPASAAGQFTLGWTNNLLTVAHPELPGGPLEIWYLEAFCLPGGQDRDWGQTKVPHKTVLVAANEARTELRFRTTVDSGLVVDHAIRAGSDELDLTYVFTNPAATESAIQWFQPACIRVAGFTGRAQSNYTARSFVFTTNGPTPLAGLRRTTAARYLGGQVYLPPWTLPADANPRPLCADRVANGLIGCVSADDRWLLATASDRTHELFEGVYVCLHSDPLVAGLKAGETRTVRQKLYFLPNDPAQLLERYRRDFPGTNSVW